MSVAAAAPQETEDPVELMLKKTGCIELHYKVQECIAETGDWRRCQEVVKILSSACKKYTEQQMKNTPNQTTAPRTKLVLVVRGDLKMSKGKTSAQCAHAAVLCYQRSQINSEKQKLVESWSLSGQPKIVLRVNTLQELMHLQNRAKDVGVVAELVRDAGRTQLEAGTATVLGIGPDIEKNINELVSDLKLL